MSTSTEVTLPRSLHEYADARARIVGELTTIYTLFEAVNDHVCEFVQYGLSGDCRPRKSLEEAIREVDRDFWRTAFDKTGLRQIMDREAKRQFEDSLKSNPPPFTIENIQAQCLELSQHAEELFARGVVNVFRRLSRDHVTNTDEPFKINERAILSSIFRPRYAAHGLEVISYNWSTEELDDIDRVFKRLDGKLHIPRTLESAINAALHSGETNTYEDDYYHIRGFRNGNAHIRFKRPDLLEKVNKIIAGYYHENALAQRKARKRREAA
jgi:hypothetical protein